jgi:hypothetical protein
MAGGQLRNQKDYFSLQGMVESPLHRSFDRNLLTIKTTFTIAAPVFGGLVESNS